MRTFSVIIVLFCGLSILVGGIQILADQTTFSKSLASFLRFTGIDNSERSRETASAALAFRGEQSAITAEAEKILKRQLQAAPTASLTWLFLAQLRHDQSPGGINSALQLSALTAPRETAIVLERAIVGLQLWDKLNQQSRYAIITDLTIILPKLNRQPFRRVRVAFATQTRESQQEIIDALRTKDPGGRYRKRLILQSR